MSFRPPRSGRSSFSAPIRRPLTIGAGGLGYDDVDTAAPTRSAEPGIAPASATVLPVKIPEARNPPTSLPAEPAPATFTAHALVTSQDPDGDVSGRVNPQKLWGSDGDLAAGEQFGDVDQVPPARAARRTARPPRVKSPKTHAKFVTGMRLLVGLDRKVPSAGKGKRSNGGDPDWLVDPDQDTTPLAAEDVPEDLDAGGGPQPDRHSVNQSATPVRAALLRRGLIDPDSDLEVVKAPREWSSMVRRGLLVTVLVLFMVAGIKQVLWNPIFGVKTPTTAVAGMNVTAADAAATRYALDYFSYSPASAAAGQSALQTDVVGGTDITAVRWSGTGYLHADSALPGAMHLTDPTHAVVQVTVRVSLGMPPAPKPGAAAAPATTTAAVPSAATADPGVLPAGWTDLGSRWLMVSVPIDASSGTRKVAASGPVLSGENPGQVTAPAGAVGDTTTSQATQGVASSFFTAYAKSDVAYLVAPGVSLQGLAGAVTLTSLTNWTVAVPAGTTGSATPTSAVGTGTVTWQITGTDLQIKQQYSMALSNSQSRWYAAALSPLSP